MTRSEVVIRPATRADIDALAPFSERPTLKAWVGEIPGASPDHPRIIPGSSPDQVRGPGTGDRGPGSGRTVGIGGFARVNGRWVAFCELSEEAQHYKRAIVEAGRHVIDEARHAGHAFIYAQVDESRPTAKRWLASLGFKPDEKTGLFRWQA